MNKPYVSIIIPAYNSKHFLSLLLEQISNQTFQDYELIIVDDGSVDGTNAFIRDKCKENKKIKYFYKNNEGVSSARNYGIKMANCEFLTFIDSDDSVEPDYLETLVNSQRSCDADIVSLPMKAAHLKKNVRIFDDLVIDGQELIIDSFFSGKFGIGPCSKLFRTKVVNEICFDSHLTVNEDKLFLFKYLLVCKTALISSKQKYTYMFRPNSLSHSTSYEKRAYDIYFVYSDIMLHLPNYKLSHLKQHNVSCLLYSYKNYYLSNIKNAKEIKHTVFFVKIKSEIKKQNQLHGKIGFRLKLEMIAFLYFLRIYHFLLKMYYKFKNQQHNQEAIQ